MFNKESSSFCAEKIQLTFTITDQDSELDTSGEEAQEVIEASKKLSLINNGLYTRDNNSGVSMNIAGDKTIIEDLGLDQNGAFATTRTVMVAETTNGTELVEQLNPASMVHIVNNEPDDEQKVYKPQMVFTTVEKYQDVMSEITAYNTVFNLRGKGKDVSETDTEAPVFELNAKPTNDYYAVDIFGHNNNILQNSATPEVRNTDVMLFSINNNTKNPLDFEGNYTTRNAVVYSNNNTIDGASKNLLLNSNYAIISGNAEKNTVIATDMARISSKIINANENKIFGSNAFIISGNNDTYNNIIIGGSQHTIYNGNNNILIGQYGLNTSGYNYQTIMGKYNKPTSAVFAYGYGSQGNNNNLMELYENGELKLYNSTGKNTITLGGNNGIQVDKLNIPSMTADNLYVTSGFTFKKISENHTEANAFITANFTDDNDINFKIKGKGYSNNNLVYKTDDGKLAVSHDIYGTTAFTTSELGYDSLYVRSRFDYGNNNIINNYTLLNGDISNTNAVESTNNTLTLGQYNLTRISGSKVKITDNEIGFYKKIATGNWVETLSITDKKNIYNKISMDVYVTGDNVSTDWHTNVRSIRGGNNAQRNFLKGLFNECPPFGYTNLMNSYDVTKIYVTMDNRNPIQASVALSDNQYIEKLAKYNSSFIDNPFTESGMAHIDGCYYITILPENIDEIEINLYVKKFSQTVFLQNDLYMCWIPVIQADGDLEAAPVVKINIIPISTSSSDTPYLKMYYYENKESNSPNYNEKTVNDAYALSLICNPYLGKVVNSTRYVVYNTNNYWCWNRI